MPANQLRAGFKGTMSLRQALLNRSGRQSGRRLMDCSSGPNPFPIEPKRNCPGREAASGERSRHKSGLITMGQPGRWGLALRAAG